MAKNIQEYVTDQVINHLGLKKVFLVTLSDDYERTGNYLYRNEEDACKKAFEHEYEFVHGTFVREESFQNEHENCNCEECQYEYKRNCINGFKEKNLCNEDDCVRCYSKKETRAIIVELESNQQSNDSWKTKYESLTSRMGHYSSFSLSIVNSSFGSDIEEMDLL